ncbi:MAG: RICIN domain-containing protein [Dysgonomonas sp.]|nr:RICIN domain-containing protein [Dysgonomonas sp.]
MQRQIIAAFSCLLLLISINLAAQINTDILYKLVSPSGLVLDNMDNPANSGQLYLGKDQKGSEGQVWKITKLENGYYIITNPFFNKSLDNDNIISGNGNRIIQ